MPTKQEAIAAQSFHNYISKADDTDVQKAISRNTKEMRRLLKTLPSKKRSHAYAEGKWTIQEVLQHIIDAERVFVYRALTFARHDSNALPGFDENIWASQANLAKRKWKDVVSEFKLVRAATELFFESLSDEDLLFKGTANHQPANALAMGYVIAGHAKHHLLIIKERYLGKK
ncbi:MAG: DinB family protein [Bacteroidetes bacterium]|nr:DinB family protein [Bacteroidota bacterium]